MRVTQCVTRIFHTLRYNIGMKEVDIKNVIIPNPDKLEKLKDNLARDGAVKLHILADFDRTLSTAFVDGEKRPSVISVLRDGGYLTPGYAAKAHALFDKYHVIEVDPGVPREEKKRAMRQWWGTHFRLLIDSGLSKKDLEDVVASGKVKLREGGLAFIDLLYKYDIPLVIMSSSGLGIDVLSLSLEKEGRMYDNVFIISNEFEWDNNGNATGIKEPIIHSMNKDETMLKNFSVFEVIKDRTNVLLLGDSLGDLGMVTGFEYDNLLSVGFLNEKVDELAEHYGEHFDVILTNDTDMGYVNTLLSEIIRI